MHDTTARELNTRICREQLAELDRDLAAGALTPAHHARSRDELQRRLLEDSVLVPAPATRRPHHSTLLIAILLPLGACGIYAALGTPEALLAPPAASAAEHAEGDAGIDQAVAALAARLEKNPGDTEGWAMLGRSYRALGRNAEAQAAFARAGDAQQQATTASR